MVIKYVQTQEELDLRNWKAPYSQVKRTQQPYHGFVEILQLLPWFISLLSLTYLVLL